MKASSAKPPYLPGKMTCQEIAVFFQNTSLLQMVPAEHLLALADKAKIRFFPKGGTIFLASEPANWLYFLYEGYVSELVSFGCSEKIIIKTRKRHDYIGEMGILSSSVYPNSAVAMSDIILIGISREAFLELMEQHVSISRCIIRQLIDRLTNSAKKMVSTMYLDAPTRLAFIIVSLSGDMAGNHKNMSLTQSDLAAASGIARQTVVKILGEWKRKGWIENERKQLSLLSVDALLNIIDEYESSH